MVQQIIMRWKNLKHPDIWIGAAVLLLLSLIFLVTPLDLALERLFYQNGWPWEERSPWIWLYRYGPLPGLLLAGAGLAAWLGGRIWPQVSAWRRPAAMVVLTFILGPGLLVNVLGKGYWGRPRPREVMEFGGSAPFHCWALPGTPGQGKSFPCGHASVGFSFMALYFAVPGRRRWVWLAGGAAYGILMGAARMAAGAHFASDVLWAGGLTYLCAALLHHVILPPEKTETRRSAAAKGRTWRSLVVFIIGLALFSGFFLLATPYYKEWKTELAIREEITTMVLSLPGYQGDVKLVPRALAGSLSILAEVRGFGFPRLRLQAAARAQAQGQVLQMEIICNLQGITTEKKQTLTICYPQTITIQQSDQLAR